MDMMSDPTEAVLSGMKPVGGGPSPKSFYCFPGKTSAGVVLVKPLAAGGYS